MSKIEDSLGSLEDAEEFERKRNYPLTHKYWTIVFPGEYGQHVQETWNEDQIITYYFKSWCANMIQSGHGDQITRERCIDDWCVLHWAQQTDQWGNPLVGPSTGVPG